MANNRSYSNSNRNAIVRTRIDATGKLRTETARRDDGLDVAISTNTRSNSTRVFIDLGGREGSFPQADLELDGRQARTLFRALAKHFGAQGKTFYV